MKLEKYEDKSKKKRKKILISLGVIVLISISLLLYKTFASFTENAEFPMMKGKVDYFGNSDIYFVFYEGDQELDEMPQKDNKENLVFDHGTCDNGASIIWDSEEWGPIVKNLSKSKTKCSLYFDEIKNSWVYIKDLAKTDTTNLWVDDTSEANIRYVGANPNNYIDIGDRDGDGNPILWRVIGVMNNITNLDNGGQKESLVKIIRADIIGSYSWDSSVSTINNGDGINEWSQADLMKLLNPKEVYSGTPIIGGSLYWNRESGNCYNAKEEGNTSCEFTNNGLSEEAKIKIAKVRWNTGTAGEDLYSSIEITAKYMYEGERSTHNGKEQCESKGGNDCNDEVERTTTWDGYIGLIYLSDYGYAVGANVRNKCLKTSMKSYNSGNCSANDWLKPSSSEMMWTMTSAPLSPFSNNVFFVHSSGFSTNLYCNASSGVFPVAYLKSDTKILPNSKPDKVYGSQENPFVLE